MSDYWTGRNGSERDESSWRCSFFSQGYRTLGTYSVNQKKIKNAIGSQWDLDKKKKGEIVKGSPHPKTETNQLKLFSGMSGGWLGDFILWKYNQIIELILAIYLCCNHLKLLIRMFVRPFVHSFIRPSVRSSVTFFWFCSFLAFKCLIICANT